MPGDRVRVIDHPDARLTSEDVDREGEVVEVYQVAIDVLLDGENRPRGFAERELVRLPAADLDGAA
jgi:uncharacterized protein (DUF2384 family)